MGMRIGLTGGGNTVEQVVAQAQQAEADGFTSLWYASIVMGDPLVPMSIAGRATSRIELGTGVLQTYPVHPLLQANRVASAANAMGRPGLTLGIGPSHGQVVEGAYGYSYATPGRNTEEYVTALTALLRNETVNQDGAEWTVHSEGRMTATEYPVPVLLSALGPRLLRVAGEYAQGAILWMAQAKTIGEHIVPRINKAAADAGRPAPRIVAGLPVAVHEDRAEAREAAGFWSTAFRDMPNYQRILERSGFTDAADAAISGDERTVRAGLQALIDAGATDIWASVFTVGSNKAERIASRERTNALLRSLL
jgi:F420-dependent oxidoreductase-like protein